MSSLVRIDFHGHKLDAIEEGGKVMVSVKRVCENLGIHANKQIRKIQQEQEFEGNWSLKVSVAADGKEREMLFLEMDAFLLWLGSLTTSRVNKSARPMLVEYKRHCKRALMEYFGKNRPALPDPHTAQQLAHAVKELEEARKEITHLRDVSKSLYVQGELFGAVDQLDNTDKIRGLLAAYSRRKVSMQRVCRVVREQTGFDVYKVRDDIEKKGGKATLLKILEAHGHAERALAILGQIVRPHVAC